MMNNKTIRMWAVGLLSLLILSGCETLGLNEYDKRNAESEALLARIDELRQLSVPNKVERIEQPPAQLTPMSQRTQVAYLSKTVAFDTPRGGAPLSSVLEDTVEPFGVRVWFGDDVSPDRHHAERGRVLHPAARGAGHPARLREGDPPVRRHRGSHELPPGKPSFQPHTHTHKRARAQ